jgi:hypothetical protein
VPFPLQLPLQQSVALEQDPPLALQHVLAAPHVSPAQQSPATAHDARTAEHPQWPEAPLQTPVQQSDPAPHALPSVMQPHVFSELQSGGWAVAQQSLFVVHPVPVYPQPQIEVTVLQIWLQHCDEAVHAAPSPEHTTSMTH